MGEEESQASTPGDPDVLIGIQWTYAAMTVGYNEMAKMQPTLPGKMFCRAMRREAEKCYREAGGKQTFLNGMGELRELTLSVIAEPMMFIESDIELMRQLVADYDAGKV